MIPPKTQRLLRAFADPTRLRILHLLTHGTLCVCEIEGVLRLPQSKVSRHLSYLREAGWVETERRGTWIDYALADPEDRFHAGLLRCLSNCFDDIPGLDRDWSSLRAFRKRKGKS